MENILCTCENILDVPQKKRIVIETDLLEEMDKELEMGKLERVGMFVRRNPNYVEKNAK